MFTTTHTVANGFCTVCGETEEWLIKSGATMVAADAPKPAEWEPAVHAVQVAGRPRAQYLGGAKRVSASRVGSWCRHYHATEAAAMKCAERQVARKSA